MAGIESATQSPKLRVMPLHHTLIVSTARVELARPFGHCLLRTAWLPITPRRYSAHPRIRTENLRLLRALPLPVELGEHARVLFLAGPGEPAILLRHSTDQRKHRMVNHGTLSRTRTETLSGSRPDSSAIWDNRVCKTQLLKSVDPPRQATVESNHDQQIWSLLRYRYASSL